MEKNLIVKNLCQIDSFNFKSFFASVLFFKILWPTVYQLATYMEYEIVITVIPVTYNNIITLLIMYYIVELQ